MDFLLVGTKASFQGAIELFGAWRTIRIFQIIFLSNLPLCAGSEGRDRAFIHQAESIKT